MPLPARTRPKLARGQSDLRVATVTTDELGVGAAARAIWPPLRLQLVLDDRADRHARKGIALPRLDVGLGRGAILSPMPRRWAPGYRPPRRHCTGSARKAVRWGRIRSAPRCLRHRTSSLEIDDTIETLCAAPRLRAVIRPVLSRRHSGQTLGEGLDRRPFQSSERSISTSRAGPASSACSTWGAILLSSVCLWTCVSATHNP